MEGELFDITFIHENWCDMLNRKGLCNCEPIMVMGAPDSPENVAFLAELAQIANTKRKNPL